MLATTNSRCNLSTLTGMQKDIDDSDEYLRISEYPLREDIGVFLRNDVQAADLSQYLERCGGIQKPWLQSIIRMQR
jgi:hypothetical protein